MSTETETVCEFQLCFNGGAPVTMKDKDLVKKIPVLQRAIESENANWETEDTKLSFPLPIPFDKESADFLFAHVRSYKVPDPPKTQAATDYPEANEKTDYELRGILELANFLECTDFMKSIGYVIAMKLNQQSVAEIARFFGAEIMGSREDLPEEERWMAPPDAFLERRD